MDTLSALNAAEPITRRIAGDDEELQQVGRIALWGALPDHTEGADFESFAARVMFEEIDYVRDFRQCAEMEFRRTTRKLEALYAAQKAGDRSAYTRQRIERLEAVQAAFCGFPEQLSQ